ncbi:MAG TPA: hypothetical protein VF629_12080 [Hymenobacter sp.]|jgi:hypothetical protein|uniref:TapB family protein n=1 Tax=Hymenobacter sp. TaxID=1898978 RepID=UPI002EDA7491
MRTLGSLFASAVAPLLLLALSGQAQSAPPAGPAEAPTCDHPFGLRESQNLEYRLLDAKGKATGTWRYRVLKISTDTLGKKSRRVATTRVRMKSGLYDLGNRVKQQQDLTVFCRRDTTFTDGMAELNYDAMDSFRDRLKAYTPTPMAWPNQPTTSSALPNGGILVQVSSSAVAIAKVSSVVRQRKVLAGPMAVTVPAGTFTCYQVESQREYATAARADLVMKSGGRTVDYYDPAVGIVKTEYYDKGGKLAQTKVLAKR